MKQKTPAIDLGLYIVPERKDGYFHVRAFPVKLNTETHGSVRNISGGSYGQELINGLMLADLVVTSQGNNDDAPRRLYGYEARYMDVYSISAPQAVAMGKSLTTIDKRMEKIYDVRGYAKSYADFVGRFAEAIGAKEIVMRPKDKDNRRFSGSLAHDEGRWCRYSIGDGISAIDQIVTEWVNENSQKEAMTA